MAMTSEVVGFKPADEKWRKMKAVWDACVAARVALPDDVAAFFHGNTPDAAGVKVSMPDLDRAGAITDYTADMQTGYTVDLAKLPKDVTVLRFVNRY